MGFIGIFFLINTSAFLRYRSNFSFSKVYYQLIQGLRENIIPDRDWKSILITIIIPIFFFFLYLILGLGLSSKYYGYDSFGADINVQTYGWTSIHWNHDYRGSHSLIHRPLIYLFDDHRGTHPLIILFVGFIGSALNYLMGGSPVITVIIINAFFASLGVFLSFIFFNLLLDEIFNATLLTLIFGLSMSQLIFGSVPENFALAGVSIIATYVLLLICLRDKKLYCEYWILTGILTFGVTITNFAQSIICFSIAVIGLKIKNKFVIILNYILVVATIAFILNTIQYIIFPNTAHLFLHPSMVNSYQEFAQITILNEPVTTLYELGKNFLIVNFVSPSSFLVALSSIPTKLQHYYTNKPPILGYYKSSLNYSLFGVMAIILWLSIFISGIFQNLRLIIKKNVNVYLFSAISLGILFNIAVHSILGVHEMFLYSCHFTFLILALATNRSLMTKTYYKTGLAALIFLMGTNNLLIIKQIINL